MDYWTDVNNPDPKLRKRKLLGMSILSILTYNPESNSWENGTVYDSGQLHVRGYWHFKFIGKTMNFIRI